MTTVPRFAPVPATPEAPDRDLAGALHEVSNALTVVLGWLERAQRAPNAAAATEAVEVALSHAALGHAIARKAVGASASGEAEVRSSLRLVQSVVRGVGPLASARQVQLLLREDAPDVMMAGATAVQQVLLNLLLNAVNFAPRGGLVEVAIKVSGGRVGITVQDNGPGVPAERQANLFRKGSSMRPGGAGIGLAHSHALAASHGGELQLLEAPGGACFRLAWPVAEAPSTPVAEVECDAAWGPLRVLILEDDQAVLQLLEVGLQTKGVSTIGLASEHDLCAFASNPTTVDAALLDLSPLAGSADSAIRRLRQAVPGVPIFLISGSCAEQHLADSVTGWIRKPFELSEVFQTLAPLSARAARSRQVG